MKIIKTEQDKIEIYPYDIGRTDPKGIETLAFVLSENQFDELLKTMWDFKLTTDELLGE